MTLAQKIQTLQDDHFSEWLKTRQQVETDISDKQGMFCVCGRLATGLHERGCRKFAAKMNNETMARIAHLLK